MLVSHHQTSVWRQNSSSKPPGAQAGLWAPIPHTELKPCPSVQVYFSCLKWKHFNISIFESMYLDPSISWIFEVGRMASIRQGKHLPGILHLFCLFVLIVGFFQKAQRKMPMPLTFLAWYFSCIEYPQVTIALLCPFRSCLVPWDWFPLMVNIHSPHLKPKEAAGTSHLSGHGQKQGTLRCTAGRRGAKLLYLCSHTCTKEMFSGLKALQKTGRALDICLGKGPRNMRCSPLLEIWMFGKGGKWVREWGCCKNPILTGSAALVFVKGRDSC